MENDQCMLHQIKLYLNLSPGKICIGGITYLAALIAQRHVIQSIPWLCYTHSCYSVNQLLFLRLNREEILIHQHSMLCPSHHLL